MARVSITVYKKSPLATTISIFGSLFVAIAILSVFAGEWAAGIVCLIIGIACVWLASTVNDRKIFKLWKKAVEEKGLQQAIAASLDVAITAYNANPGKRTLNYIRSLNPQFANIIQMKIDEQKAKK